MEEKKLTKKEFYELIKEVVTKSDAEDKDNLIDFLDRQVEILENKAEKAKERAAEKRAAGDELRGVIKTLLTSEYQTADEIVAKFVDEDVTKAKVVARLGQLVKNEEVEKTDIKTEDGRTVKAYRLAE